MSSNINTLTSTVNKALARTTIDIDEILIDIFSNQDNLGKIITYLQTSGSGIRKLIGTYTDTTPQTSEKTKYQINEKIIYFAQGQTNQYTTFYINNSEVTGANTSYKYIITPINSIKHITTTVTLPDGSTETFLTPSTEAMFGQFNTVGTYKSISTVININNITTGTNIRTTITLKFKSVVSY